MCPLLWFFSVTLRLCERSSPPPEESTPLLRESTNGPLFRAGGRRGLRAAGGKRRSAAAALNGRPNPDLARRSDNVVPILRVYRARVHELSAILFVSPR